jgi:hypothetical protein
MSEEQLPEGEVEGGATQEEQEGAQQVEGEEAFEGQEGKFNSTICNPLIS